jgi:hypothetical protein
MESLSSKLLVHSVPQYGQRMQKDVIISNVLNAIMILITAVVQGGVLAWLMELIITDHLVDSQNNLD